MKRIVTFVSGLFFLSVAWCLSVLILWWSYDMNAQTRGGVYSRHQALSFVFAMALITTTLTGVVWITSRTLRNTDRWIVTAWSIIWRTTLLELAYAVVVVTRRQVWNFRQGLGDGNMFFPIVGHINAQFFSEWNWMSFVLEVVPAVGLISGILYCLYVNTVSLYERHA